MEEVNHNSEIKRLTEELLHNPDPRARADAAEALGRLGNEDAIEPLMLALADRFGNVYGKAIEALRSIGGPKVIKPFAENLMHHADPRVRASAAYDLGRIGGQDALEVLLLALDDKDSKVYFKVIEALGTIGGTQVIKPLIAALSDPSVTSMEAIESLIDIGTPAIPFLREALENADPKTRQKCEIILSVIAKSQDNVS